MRDCSLLEELCQDADRHEIWRRSVKWNRIIPVDSGIRALKSVSDQMEFCGELVAPLHKIRRGLRAQGELKCISIGRSCDKIHWHHWAEQGGDLLACQNRLRIEGKGDG